MVSQKKPYLLWSETRLPKQGIGFNPSDIKDSFYVLLCLFVVVVVICLVLCVWVCVLSVRFYVHVRVCTCVLLASTGR